MIFYGKVMDLREDGWGKEPWITIDISFDYQAKKYMVTVLDGDVKKSGHYDTDSYRASTIGYKSRKVHFISNLYFKVLESYLKEKYGGRYEYEYTIVKKHRAGVKRCYS